MTTNRDHLAFVWDIDSPHFSRRTFMQARWRSSRSAAGRARRRACGSTGERQSRPGRRPSKAEASSTSTTGPTTSTDDTIPNFEKATGIKVTYDNYSSNDELFAKMRTGGTGFDIIVPTDATLVKMKHANLLEPLDLAHIPNVKNLDPRFRTAAYDPGNKYSIPWQWGTTGIGYDKTKVGGEVTDWDAFDLPRCKGRARSSTKRATRSRWRLFALGKDPNTLDADELDDAPTVPDRPEEEDQVRSPPTTRTRSRAAS